MYMESYCNIVTKKREVQDIEFWVHNYVVGIHNCVLPKMDLNVTEDSA